MISTDRLRRIQIVNALMVIFAGLAVGYLVPEILGLVVKIRATDPAIAELKPWDAAMASMPIRIVHIIGLVITGIAAIFLFRIWSLRFVEPREGET